MPKFVNPTVYLVGQTTINAVELWSYLADSGNGEFLDQWHDAVGSGLSEAEILCSVYAKLCYKSLSPGKNANVTKTRDIVDNLANCFHVGHMSIFEHIQFNFIVHNCSRVFTHEKVRHRLAAYSQTSGRFCRLDEISIVNDPILVEYGIEDTEVLEVLAYLEDKYAEFSKKLDLDNKDFATKKRLTSALRRFLVPTGISNELGFSVNLRQLRHEIMMRTSRSADWEIRSVFNQVFEIMEELYPLLMHGAKQTYVDGDFEITGMRNQPYEVLNVSNS